MPVLCGRLGWPDSTLTTDYLSMDRLPETQEILPAPAHEEEQQVVPMAVNGDEPTVEEPVDIRPTVGQSQEPVPYQVFVHAPQYHWHVGVQPGLDTEARAAVKTLHANMHRFARETVREVKALQTAVCELQARAGQVESVVVAVSG